MQYSKFLFLVPLLMVTSNFTNAQDTVSDATSEHPSSIPKPDAPELAALGNYTVGVREITFTDPERPSLLEAIQGRGPSPRAVPLHIWYPAQTVPGDTKPAEYIGKLPIRPGKRPENMPTHYVIKGIAYENVKPVSGERFPLVIVSHGYGNWSTFLSYLTENLASKGYVVAAIEHNDLPYTDFQSFGVSFGSTILNRARDQRFIMDQLTAFASTGNDPLASIIDAENIGLIGYSMGGFGALASAGAPYDTASPSFTQIPPQLSSGIMEGDSDDITPHPALKAVTLIAPWGGAPANRSWTAEALAGINRPLFYIVGDQDDVSGYDDGVRWLYDNTTGTRRHMLVYNNARHSVGGNPPPPIADTSFDLTDWFNEPVWRRDRITAINQHFITAFMGYHLKNDNAMADYMNVSPVNSNDGEWPIKLGAYVGDAYSSGSHDGKSYWKGFQRRYAVGMEMHKSP